MFDFKIISKSFFAIFILGSSIKGAINFSGEGGSLNLSAGSGRVSLEQEMVIGSGCTIDLLSLTNNFASGSGSFNVLLKNATLKIGKGIVFVSDGAINCSSSNPDNIIVLNDGATVWFNQELPLATLHFLVPASCAAKFSGPVNFTGTITLQDSSSSLIFDVNTSGKFVLNLNGGTLKLLNDFKIDNDQGLVGGGLIDLNGCQLTTRADISSQLSFVSEGKFNIFGRSQINAPLYFNNQNGQVLIQGADGQEIVMGSSGAFVVSEACQLGLKDVNLQGLTGSSMFNLFDSPTSPGVVSFYSCSLNLTGSIALNSGQIKFFGSANQIVGGNASFFSINGPDTHVIVDGGELNYFCTDTLNPLGFPFLFYGPDSLVFINGGTLSLKSTEASNLIDALANNGGTVYLTDQLYLSPTNKIIVSNIDSFHAKTITIDGSGRTWTFKKGGGEMINIAQNVSVTVANVRLSGFYSQAFTFGTGSSLFFGPNVTIEPAWDFVITWPINLLNDIKFRGDNSRISLAIQGAITVIGSPVNITFEKCQLAFVDPLGLTTNDTSNVFIKDSRIDLMGQIVNFSAGNFHFISTNKIYSSSEYRSLLAFNSKGTFTVGSASTLSFGPNVDFLCNPDSSLDSSVSVTKRHFLMADHSSKVIFDRATFGCANKGLALEHGTFVAKNWFTLTNTGVTTSDDVEIYQAFSIESSGAPKITLDGKFRYL